MSDFVLFVVILHVLRVVLNTIALANAWKPNLITPGNLAWRVVFSSAWVAWGIYLLTKGAA
jgi:hypothetical protein